METIALITADQLKNLRAELRTYDVNWMERLVKHFEDNFPEEKEDFNKSKLYSVFSAKKKNALHVSRVFTEAQTLLATIKKEFEQALPPTTIKAFNNQKSITHV